MKASELIAALQKFVDAGTDLEVYTRYEDSEDGLTSIEVDYPEIECTIYGGTFSSNNRKEFHINI